MAMSDRDRRALIILGAIAGLAIAFFLVTQVLGGGGGEQAADDGGTAPTTQSPTVAPTVTGSPEVEPPKVVSFSGRDPFVTPSVLLTASATASGTSTSTASPTDGGTSTTSPTATSTVTGNTSTVSSTSVGGHDVALLAVYRRGGEDRAQVSVDGTVHRPSEGERFAGNFRLVSADPGTRCARIVFGDEGFTLCTSQQK